MRLWEGTEFAQLAVDIDRKPELMDAWRMGVCDQTVADLLGVGPDEDNVPNVAREVATRMMRALSSGKDFATVVTDCAALIQNAKARAN
jgi:hypothetical protein